MSRGYFENLPQKTLIDVACRLHDLSVDLIERLEQNSQNSSKPPSSDSPFSKGKTEESEEGDKDVCSGDDTDQFDDEQSSDADEPTQPNDLKRFPGKQPGSQGFWRSETPVPEKTVPHYPEACAICGRTHLKRSPRPHMGFYVYELEKTDAGVRIRCTLEHYYKAVCYCGHETTARPGEGVVSELEGRKKI